MDDLKKRALAAHEKWRGKIRIEPVARATTPEELSLAYTPGVAEPCLAIRDDPSLSYKLTRRWNTVAVITDGTAILGLGDIGGVAGMPVMEGKCLLFKEFADIDAVPLCVGTRDTDEFVSTVANIADSFGGINLEDISAPRCFEIERKLKAACSVPVFHDDQHGTAIIVGAALINAFRLTGRRLSDSVVVINGAGAAGCSIGRHLMDLGAKNVVFVDKSGAIVRGEAYESPEHAALSLISNPEERRGTLAEVIKGADAVIGVSRPGLFTEDMIRSMAKDPVVFALANPTPEIMPDRAVAAGAAVVGTGRSDFKNQINNVLAFPGIFRGVLDAGATDVNAEMKKAATSALVSLVSDDELSPDYVIPSAFDRRVVKRVAEAVAEAARRTGAVRDAIR
ncbi:MAG: NADP-dependent malic enzyme [Clostridia bacterium]|nr:NADP-dependent malic enzyme [Clostridia bacterium]